MAERPIIMQAESVRAILAGTKTQTRRAVKPQPKRITHLGPLRAMGWSFGGHEWLSSPTDDVLALCPYGAAGDRLWVREGWRYADASTLTKPVVEYRADLGGIAKTLHRLVADWRSPIFMPRSVCRLVLEVVSVRVERVQEISEGDAQAEGCSAEEHVAWTGFDPLTQAHPTFYAEPLPEQRIENVRKHVRTTSARDAYQAAWERINGKRKGCAWADNPWVWVVEFKRVSP